MLAIEARSTSPANTFPKRRKESEATFAISPMISISPTKNVMGETMSTVGSFLTFVTISESTFTLINLLNVFQSPIETIPKRFAPMTEMSESASVVLMSAVPPRK